MPVEVIRADYHNPRHASDLLELLDEYACHPMGGGQPLSAYTREHLLATLAGVPNAFSVLCYVDSQPAGLINCFQGFSTFKCKPLINLHDVIVSEPFRGQGLTQLLLAEVEQVARERGCCKLTLEVLDGNPIAQHAYRVLGFESYELDPLMGKANFWEKVF